MRYRIKHCKKELLNLNFNSQRSSPHFNQMTLLHLNYKTSLLLNKKTLLFPHEKTLFLNYYKTVLNLNILTTLYLNNKITLHFNKRISLDLTLLSLVKLQIKSYKIFQWRHLMTKRKWHRLRSSNIHSIPLVTPLFKFLQIEIQGHNSMKRHHLIRYPLKYQKFSNHKKEVFNNQRTTSGCNNQRIIKIKKSLLQGQYHHRQNH